MNQTRLQSFIESIVNVIIGFGISYAANMVVLPMFGYHVTHGAAFGIGIIYTIISIVRSYCIRRWFNARLKAFAHRVASC